MITAFERFAQWLNGELPSFRAAEWIEKITTQVNKSTILTGSGSPEGVVEANPEVLYMDTSGTAGNILYIKKTGTGDTGWILV